MKSNVVVIELTGIMKRQALEAWLILKEKQSIHFISDNSPCPHFMLVDGIPCKELPALEAMLKSLSDNQKAFTVFGNGLGIFVREQPVIHIRWILDDAVFTLRREILSNLGRQQDLNWVAKTSLAYKDTSYSTLPQSLELLCNFNYDEPMEVGSLAIYQIEEGKPELKLSEFPLQLN